MNGSAGSHCDHRELAAYCAGELDEAARLAVDRHLVQCGDCWSAVRISREAALAVRRTAEPAPLGLRADVHSAITSAASNTPRARRRPRTAIAVAAAAVLVASTGVGWQLRSDEVPSSATAAISAFNAATIGGSTAAAAGAPDLTGAGLQIDGAASTSLAGTSSMRYTYVNKSGARVVVFVAREAWQCPAGCQPLGTQGWMFKDHGMTVIAGPGVPNEQMLIVAADHTLAMSVAATLAVV